jgi:glycolate oxidase
MEREKLVEEMTKIVGKENVLFSDTDLLLYGYDASLYKGKPDCIVLPGSTEDVSKVVKGCVGMGPASLNTMPSSAGVGLPLYQ